jgi:hypothetical protein
MSLQQQPQQQPPQQVGLYNIARHVIDTNIDSLFIELNGIL